MGFYSMVDVLIMFFLFAKISLYNVEHTASILTNLATITKIPTATEIKAHIKHT
jgi:hypothetical protein